jgi:hypothetical protein
MSFRFEPYLWIHLAGIVVLPLCLEVVWLSLGVGTPQLPFWLELLFIAAVGILPVLWMQWTRPFNIFSLLFLALQLDRLSERQRQILTAFQSPKTRILAIASAAIMLFLLWQLYHYTPIAVPAAASLLPPSRWLALAIAAVAFLAGNLFLQIPLSVLGVLLTSPQRLETLEPMSVEQIPQKTTLPGLRVRQILPPLAS